MQLFIERFCEDISNHLKIIKWGIPNIVWIYFGIPGVVFLGYIYYNLWYHNDLYWNESMPFGFLYFILLLVMSTGNIRSYLLAPDLFFLIQKPKILTQMRISGFLVTILKNTSILLLLMLLILPILINVYQLTILEIGALFLSVLAYNVIVLIIRRNLKNSLIKNLLILTALIVFLLIGTRISGLLSFMILGVAILYFIRGSQTNRHFIKEVEIERKQRNKWNQLIFMLSANFVEGAPTIDYQPFFGSASEPRFLFPKSRRIFKERTSQNDFLEFCLKALIRDRTFRGLYVKAILIPFLGPFCIQILFQFVLPIWVRLMFYPVMIYVLYQLTKFIYWDLTHHSFFQVVQIDGNIKCSSERRFQIWVISPIAVLTAMMWMISL